jgi:nucleotide-binding universal stress UspA family protein
MGPAARARSVGTMKIIAAIDGGPRQRDALALGAELARVRRGELVVAHVYVRPLPTRVGGAPERRAREAARATLEVASRTLGDVAHRAVLAGGSSVAHALDDLAVAEQADLLVVGSSHRGTAGRVLFGTVGDRLLHGASCAVAVAPRGYADAPRPLRAVGVAYDAGAEARAALLWAEDLAAAAGARLHLLSVAEPMPVTMVGGPPPTADLHDALVEERREELREAVLGVPVSLEPTATLLEGPAARCLATAATELDLLVCGSRGYGPVGSVLLGSVSKGLFHEASCPVVALPRSAAHDRPADLADVRVEEPVPA